MSGGSPLLRYSYSCLKGNRHAGVLCLGVHWTRNKSDDATSKEMVVEKEKKKFRWAGNAINWDGLPWKFGEFKEHVKEIFKHPRDQRLRGRGFKDDEILYHFREKEDLDNWFTATDEAVGGKSWAEFVQSDNGMTAAFRGYISQRLPRYMLPSSYDQLENKPYYRGFATLETKPFLSMAGRQDFQNLVGMNTFEIRLRGEGRKYMFEMNIEHGIGDMMYTIPIHTRGGPNWETVQLPFGKFISSKRSTFTSLQHSFTPTNISCFRFLLLDNIEGPFQLELDYIGLAKDFTQSHGPSDYWDPHMNTNSMIGTW